MGYGMCKNAGPHVCYKMHPGRNSKTELHWLHCKLCFIYKKIKSFTVCPSRPPKNSGVWVVRLYNLALIILIVLLSQNLFALFCNRNIQHYLWPFFFFWTSSQQMCDSWKHQLDVNVAEYKMFRPNKDGLEFPKPIRWDMASRLWYEAHLRGCCSARAVK